MAMENDGGGNQSFFHVRIFLRIFVASAKFFFGNLLFTTKSGAEVQILQNDKKVDVCVEMRAELW